MFETFAALSTISFIIIFVVLIQIDRAGRREDARKQGDSAQRPGA
jgi:hypothetical protein